MKLSILAASALFASQATAYSIVYSSSLNCRKKPTAASDKVKVFQLSDDIQIECQIPGQEVNGNKLWDLTQDGCYVSDYYVLTGAAGYIAPRCDGGSTDVDDSDSSSGKASGSATKASATKASPTKASATKAHTSSKHTQLSGIEDESSADDASDVELSDILLPSEDESLTEVESSAKPSAESTSAKVTTPGSQGSASAIGVSPAKAVAMCAAAIVALAF